MLSVLNKIGGNHNSCQDAVFVTENETHVRGGVFDGCSSGTHSEFVSQFLAYHFEKNVTECEVDFTGNMSISSVFDILQRLSYLLELKPINLQSTMLLFDYDKQEKQLKVRSFGDGVYYINDAQFEYNLEKGLVDYVGDNIGLSYPKISEYLAEENHKTIVHEDVYNFMICSDGIKAIVENQFFESKINPSVLFARPTGANYLERMYNLLVKNKYTFKDDITIISYDSESNEQKK